MIQTLLLLMVSLFLCLTASAQMKIVGKKVIAPVFAAPIAAGPALTATTGPTCEKVSQENCLAENELGDACRKKFREECTPFLEEAVEEEVAQVSTTQTTIAPFFLNAAGMEREALVKDAPKVENLTISGMSSSFQSLQIPALIGKYKLHQFGTIAPISASAALATPIAVATPTATATKKPMIASKKPIAGVATAPTVVTVTTTPALSVAAIISTPSTIIHMPLEISKIKLQEAIDKRERWASQAGFESCEEFVYERFRNLSTLEDSASSLRNDPVAIFKFIRSKNWLNHNYFIPTYNETGRFFVGNWIVDPDWKPYHKEPIMMSLDQNGNWPKNAFTSYQISNFPESTIDRTLSRLVSMGLNDRTELTLENQLAMADRLTAENISTEYLEQMQDLGKEYIEKLKERMATYAEYTRAQSDADYICILPAGAGGGPSNCEAAQNGAQSKLTEVRARLIPIDGEINQMLTYANNVGCFDDNNIKCDWAPSIMLKTLDWGLHKFKKRREEEYDMCNLALKPQLTGSGNQYVIPTEDYNWIVTNPNYQHHFNYPNQGWMWKQYPQDFIKYMQFAWQYYKNVQEEMKEVKKFANIDHPTQANKKQIGNLKADNGFYGTDKLGGIGAGYAYTAGWMIKDYESNIYRTNSESFSSFALHALVFGKKFDIVDYTGDTKTLNSNSIMNLRLKILDKNWVPPYGKNATFGMRFLVDSTLEKKLFSKHKYINVFGLPIRLEAGAYARAGFKADLVHNITRRTSDDSIYMSSNGSFQPYTALTAYGSAAVDAVVARIGIRGRLDLLTLGLPLEINHQVFKREPDYLSAFTTDTSLGIELGTLSGRFSAFMDTIFGDLEQTIFKWKGVSYTHNLFEVKTEQPFALKFARQSLGIQQ